MSETKGNVSQTPGCVRKNIGGYARFEKKKFMAEFAIELLKIQANSPCAVLHITIPMANCEENQGLKSKRFL